MTTKLHLATIMLTTALSSIQLIVQVQGAKIIIIGYQQPSHVIMKLGIGTDLIRRGHEVYYALTYGYPKIDAVRQSGIRIIHYHQPPDVVYPFMAESEDRLAEFIYERKTLQEDIVVPSVIGDCKALITDTIFLDRVKASNFDMAIVEPFIACPCYLLVPYYLGIPFVSATAGIVPLHFRLSALPSFHFLPRPGPDIVDVSTMNTFVDRLKNFFMLTFVELLFLPKLWEDTTLLRKYAPSIDSWGQLMLRSQMILIENDYHLDSALPLLPHAVTIAGCTARPYAGLPVDLERIVVQSSENGVILASFGTSAYRMPSHIAAKFLQAFGRLKETVFTKMAVPANIEVPDNVHMRQWFPQNDVLGHPNTKLFITHSGSNSQYEALYHGVPMLGIPMFAEQGWNCGRARHRGIGLCLDLLEFTADELHDHIRELIDNGTYRANIRKLSEIWRDQPMNCTEKAGYWISHVIKYGASHLRSPALDQSLVQFLMLDLVGFLFLGMVVVGIVSIILFLAIVRKVIRGRMAKDKEA